ncbi:PEBP-like protein [Melanomma pulvis-pyrius CBS 109.77]|uniref:PEBP-like protein n=1 Tax=Melanomma pulvis-pyrius CBS 109.77 TaxID=1314802 RepID=A0A6A6X2M3_9PLEO|nr:PEBP-like protein [Melanomma pulvis-pyrius CBS 109.77]
MGSVQLLDSLAVAKLLPSRVIPEGFTPSVEFSVTFDNKRVENGNLFRVSEVKFAPTISFSAPFSNTYALLLVDPDAPTPDDPKFAYWRHWVVSGIRPSALDKSEALLEKPALTEYLAPGVKDESAPHRYTFLLYKEPADFSLSKSDIGGEEFVDRRSFEVNEWVRKHGLELVGVNWMLGAGDGWKA